MPARPITAGRCGTRLYGIATKEDADGRKTKNDEWIQKPIDVQPHDEPMTIEGVFCYPRRNAIAFSVSAVRFGYAMHWRTAEFPLDAVIWTDQDQPRR